MKDGQGRLACSERCLNLIFSEMHMPNTHLSRYFTADQRATVAAVMARIIPTDDTPGATEAGCVDFVDQYLSGIGYIFAKPDGSGFEILTGATAKGWQQRIDILRKTYAEGIAALEAAAVSRFQTGFANLWKLLARKPPPLAEHRAKAQPCSRR
jgi:hypothetical protein